MKKVTVILFLVTVLLFGSVQSSAGTANLPDADQLAKGATKTVSSMNISIEDSVRSEPMKPAGGILMAGYLIFFFIYVRSVQAVKLYGKEHADSKTETLLKELHVNPKSKSATDIDLTGLFDYTCYPCIKVKWNPKAFRNKTDVTIRYLFDEKVIHEDFFRSKKEVEFEITIEMVEKENEAGA